MNKKQLTELVIIPTLRKIPNGYSKEAVKAIQMIIAHESVGGEYIAQTKGPALGVIQMEPFTHNEVWKWGDSIAKNAIALGIVQDESRLVYDLRYNVFMARQKLFMASGALPSNEFEMAEYLKLNWNGDGKATAQKYYDDFIGWA
tara:strand:- start:59 stop:493 length:435 start_codon:yes stop_codon:yes gene_type:complete